MKFNIKNNFTCDIQFTADIDCNESTKDSLADANRSRPCSRGDIVAALLERNRQDPGTVDVKTMVIKRKAA